MGCLVSLKMSSFASRVLVLTAYMTLDLQQQGRGVGVGCCGSGGGGGSAAPRANHASLAPSQCVAESPQDSCWEAQLCYR